MTDTLDTRTAHPGESLANPALFRQQAFIAGEWVAADGRAMLDVTDPASGACVGTVPACGTAETRRAIAAAEAAQAQWRHQTPQQRSAVIEEWHRLILANQVDLARIITVEQGKPLPEAAGEIAYAASFVKWFAAEGLRIHGHEVGSPFADRRILVRKEPIGVTAAITPWNFPAAMITRKAAPALVAGCAMIVKPSELTPFTALALAALAEEAGLPKGVLSVVTGLPAEIGAELTSSPVVRMLTFTGSTRVGALLMEQCGATVKKMGLELGGNAPFIVFDDADVDLAVEGAIASKFRNAGQTCVCTNRFYVQAGIHNRFVEKLGAAVRALKVGPGTEDGVEIGPLINQAAKDKVEAHVNDALAKGAQIAAQCAAPEGFAAPIVLAGVTEDMRVCHEETFGPLAPVIRFSDEAEAIRAANDTPYGLAAYFYTRDMDRAWRVSEALVFGMVGLNTGAMAMEVAPFGGMKQSGLGREGASEGLEEFLEAKTFHWAGIKGA
ncbi:NAD-dependent succinate-semialdehyde dehydrogenase [Novosphingobium sp. BW1]|uniref:NAD-dependent succinate-semialdehyde dehydrogenase n=1 Tax=Novosphingobium sp. BW1 TaxID=2592621 RepID=UPI0011DE9D28|nr:NAD-dependent succinate-semialdehyde dehydrogenase [Novosphingobium sp. BW1]TYC89293.1 NAD-dependent succinate-semialdehyde dehydrogenase [Novosphingobium sp. BW1]